MRREDIDRWIGQLRAPVERFVRQSRVRLVLLIDSSGQVLGQHGFVRAADVTNIASLGAGIHASSHALANLLGEAGFGHLLQGGEKGQVFLGPFHTPGGSMILIAVFGPESTIGLVRVFFEALVTEIAALPGWDTVRAAPPRDAESFERALEGGVQRLFPGS